ncbi:hypothetical protein GCM10011352_19050 [Marinobacterium zhoushanense]|uniref:Exo-alpha-sialidase n=1 Tax=Marinobacterium zhoushanense TaxID=1679163 RepID=A0ABQ1K9V5_9GAMM|nr:exo-alpha-sialidase [Marinobacterium zhoushanense]GGB93181.1 hypothetical protein GCM10011352_19050 [Marinobacterium zhoushanense]
MQLLSSQRLWNRAAHNAFTDLARFNGRLYVVFREGLQHISDAGVIRVLSSADAQLEWQDTARIALDGADLRDAKLSITPDNRLMLLSAAAKSDGPVSHQTKAWFSDDGEQWSDPVDISEPNHWLWRLTWHQKFAYGLAYGTAGTGGLYWYRVGMDGQWHQHRLTEFDGQYVNEHDLCFDLDGTAWCLLRRDNAETVNSTGLLGYAAPPYREWTWKDIGVRIGGPCLIWDEQHSGFLAAYRRYQHPAQWLPQWTEISRLSKEAELGESVALTSGGDCSYPGLLLEENHLTAVYYSSHEEDQGTAIYLADLNLSS